MTTLQERHHADQDDADRYTRMDVIRRPEQPVSRWDRYVSAMWACDEDFMAAVREVMAVADAESTERDATINRLRQTLFEVLASFTQRTHPGRQCLRTDHIAVEVVAKWRAALDSTP